MKIRRLRIDGFGNLRGDFIFSSDRCNLILEPNETGKSTLAAAIVAALYGFPRKRATRERPMKMKDQYRPWSGLPFAVEMDVECRGRVCTIRRDFEEETATVTDGATGRDITAEFSRSKENMDFGEAMTGLSREDFARCCFVGQREIESLSDAGSLTHALQRIASSQRGDVAAGEAIDTLTRAAERDYHGMKLGRGKVDTEIKRLEEEIDSVRAEMEEISARRRASEDKIRRLEAATHSEGKAEADLSRVDFLCMLAGRNEARSALSQSERDAGELSKYREEVAALSPYAAFPAGDLDHLKNLRTKVESLQTRHKELTARIAAEVESPLIEAERELETLSTLAGIPAAAVENVSDRLAVLTDLWAQRRAKRTALAKEEQRLTSEGVDPARVRTLASTFSGLDDDERQFLAGYREKILELKAALSEAELDRDRRAKAEGTDSPALVSLASARRVEAISLFTGFIFTLLTPLLWYTIDTKIPAMASLVLGVAGFLWWARLQEQRPVHGAEEFGSDLQRIQTALWAREKELASLQEQISILAAKVNHPRPDRLVEEFKELETLREKASHVALLAASLQEIQHRYDAAAAEILDLMQRVGRVPAHRLVTPRVARRFKMELDNHAVALRRIESLRADQKSGGQEIEAIERESQSLLVEARRLYAAAFADSEPPADLDAAVSRFAEAAAHRDRLEQLAGEILPSVEARLEMPAEQRVATLKKEIAVLTRQVERATRQNSALAGLEALKSSREYAEERRRLAEDVRATQKERLALSEELGDVLKEYRRDYPGRQSMLASLEMAHERAVAFRDAVAISVDVLTSISQEAYSQWADVLNDKTGEILRRLNPNYGDVLFDTDLTFTVKDARTGRRLDQNGVDAQLSAGARDQIYLAVRMAVSDYISTGGARLPFVLDDPFATFDDERFERAMEFLIDTLSRRHQVIVLSCHEQRHRSWQERSAGRHAEKVRFLDLTPLST